jgi:hypothetical protein
VSNERETILAERKALLATRAELDRARVSLAAREIRSVVTPSPAADRVTRLKPAATLLTGLLGSLAGGPRLGRWLRIASFALAAIRIARNWR